VAEQEVIRLARQLSVSRVRDAAQEHVQQASPGIELLGRMGYAAKGVVYGLVGLLAAQAAAGVGGDVTDTEGVLRHVVNAPFGQVLLGVIALGLVGYALWSAVQAMLDTENHGHDPQGLVTRAGYLLTAVLYAGLALSALKLLTGGGPGAGGDASAQDRTAWLMDQPLGSWLVALVGLGIVGFGLFQVYAASTERFCKTLERSLMDGRMQTWAIRAGKWGYAARGVVLVLVGGFLVQAGLDASPDRAHGLGGALATLASQPAGPWLLGAVAVGLMAYGAYSLVEARYRRLDLRGRR
jgi:hypothetical protein